MKITITQEYTLEIPKEYADLPREELVDSLNAMYDIHGKHIIETLSAEEEYVGTVLTHIDDKEVYLKQASFTLGWFVSIEEAG